MKYPIAIHKDKNTDYGITVPDLPGCFSAGESIEDAITQAKEAIECHLEGLLLNGDPIPSAKKIENYRHHRAYKEAIWALVEVDLSKLSGHSKRINITLPENLLHQLDKCASKEGYTRSGLLAQLAFEHITHI